jgi:cation diffusion facilitator family transporter
MVHSKISGLIPDYGNPTDPIVRAKYGYLEAGISIIGNFALFILKLFLGIFINSIALIADSIHTLSDVGTSILIIFGFSMAKKPADKNHPYGHGRMEHVATLVMTVLLFIAGVTFIWQSFTRFSDLMYLLNSEYATLIGVIIIITAIIKELMAQYSMAISELIKSDVLVADAWHHRSDAFASVAVGLSIIGSNMGVLWLDPMFGVIVSIIIIYVGYTMFRKTSNVLIGTAPDADLIEEIRRAVMQIEEGKDIENINVHDYGLTKIVSLNLCVDKTLSVEESSRIADRIEDHIKKELGYLSNIRIEPRKDGSDKPSPDSKAISMETSEIDLSTKPQVDDNETIKLYMDMFDINRNRAENIYNAGYKRPEDLNDAIPEDLVCVDRINPTIAKRIVNNLKDN